MISRVGDQNLSRFVELIRKETQTAYPEKNWPQIRNWLQRAMIGNEYFFVSSQNAIGLFQKVTAFARTIPDLEEIFCLGLEMPRDKEQVFKIYYEALTWASRSECAFMFLGNCSQLDKDDFKLLFHRKIGQEVRPYTVVPKPKEILPFIGPKVEEVS